MFDIGFEPYVDRKVVEKYKKERLAFAKARIKRKNKNKKK